MGFLSKTLVLKGPVKELKQFSTPPLAAGCWCWVPSRGRGWCCCFAPFELVNCPFSSACLLNALLGLVCLRRVSSLSAGGSVVWILGCLPQ